MRRLLIVLGALFVLCSCTSLSQEEYDELAALPARIESVYDQADALVKHAEDLWGQAQETGSITPELLAEVRSLYGEAKDIYKEGEVLIKRADELRKKAADGDFDLEGLWYLLTGLLSSAGSLGLVRLQRGPSKPMSRAEADALRRVAQNAERAM